MNAPAQLIHDFFYQYFYIFEYLFSLKKNPLFMSCPFQPQPCPDPHLSSKTCTFLNFLSFYSHLSHLSLALHLSENVLDCCFKQCSKCVFSNHQNQNPFFSLHLTQLTTFLFLKIFLFLHSVTTHSPDFPRTLQAAPSSSSVSSASALILTCQYVLGFSCMLSSCHNVHPIAWVVLDTHSAQITNVLMNYKVVLSAQISF